MAVADIERVVDAWIEETISLGGMPNIASRADFREPGRDDGRVEPASARPDLGDPPSAERARKGDAIARPTISSSTAGRCSSTISLRSSSAANASSSPTTIFASLVPFWAVWPFETMILPRRRIGGFDELSAPEKSVAGRGALRAHAAATTGCSASRSPIRWASTRSRPTARVHAEWQMHAHFYPPLLRSATVRKFMVGFEMLGSPQRDLTPEAAAARLRETAA